MALTETPAVTEPTDADRDTLRRALGALFIALDDVPDPLHRLALVTSALHGLQGEQERTVAACREVQVPWQLIADAASLNSKQAAQARWGGQVRA